MNARGRRAISYNSCRNRHCPKCQGNARHRWLDARRVELLPTRYVHVVFTLPHELAPLALVNKKTIYGLLFRLSAETLLAFARDPRWLGADIGFFSVLHTWNQKLEHHPHVHCVVPEGGISLDGSRWVRPRYNNLAARRAFADLLGRCRRHDWVVYAKRPFGGPEHVLQYLGNYIHRIAISNHRLVGLADGKVSFRWRDSAHKNRKRVMTLAVGEFLRRFFLHVLPPGFVRIRYFGFLASRQRKRLLPLCRQLLAEATADPINVPFSSAAPGATFWTCPLCGGVMVIVERLTAAEMYIRPPPALQEIP